MNNNNRQRTFNWQDPLIGANAAKEMDGLDYLLAIQAGSIPDAPIFNLVDFKLSQVKKGEITFEFDPKEFHYNIIGTVHGGIPSTLLDSAMGCAVHSMLTKGAGWTTLELKVNFVKAIYKDTGLMRCTGKIIHPGRRIMTTEAQLVDTQGKLYAHGTSTCLIL